MTLADLLRRSRTALEHTAGLSTGEARQEAWLLASHVLGVGRSWLISHERDEVPPSVAVRLSEAVRERAGGRPLAYILGEWAFHDLTLVVNEAVLVPRADTETLVEAALARIPGKAVRRILDLGTGSGAVALALAKQRPQSLVLALDRSDEALNVARQNARRNRLENVRFVRGDWMHGLTGDFDIIVSNPPYLPEADPHLLQGGLPFEPRAALASGADGLDAIRTIVKQAPAHLAAGGFLLLEHGFDQAGAVRDLLRQAGFDGIFTERDLPGQERVSGGSWKN